MNHIGGDGFWLIREPNGRVRTIMAAGRAGAKATPRLYREPATTRSRRADRSRRSPCRAPSAAGCSRWRPRRHIGGTAAARCAARSRHRQARNGYVVTRSQARLTAEKLPSCKVAPGFAETFLDRRQAAGRGRDVEAERASPRRSSISRMPGLDDFYRGDVGREIAADLERIGSPVTRDDLENCRAAWPSR